jgi:hypothetical protein
MIRCRYFNLFYNQIIIILALWSVMFSTFAFYFMKYNSRKFYEDNKEWGKFDDELRELQLAR